MRVVVTGASGSLGRHLLGTLTAAGHEVTGLVRAVDPACDPVGGGVRLVVGDVRLPETLASAFAGRDAVVHTVAQVDGRAAGARRQTDRLGTTHVMAAARDHGCRRFVHVSSIAVYDGLDRGERLDEQSELRAISRRANPYASSKVEVETLARTLAARYGLELTVLRPGVFLGSHDRHTTPAALRLLRSPLRGMIGRGQNRIPCVDLDELAALIATALVCGKAAGRIYNVVGRHTVTQEDLLRIHTQPRGNMPHRHYPTWLARGFAALCDAYRGLGAQTAPLLLDRLICDTATMDCMIDCTRASRDLGWRGARDPASSVAEALALRERTAQ